MTIDKMADIDELKLEIPQMEGGLRFRLMKLHQEKLKVALARAGVDVDSFMLLSHRELEDLCEFMNSFLYE